MNLVMFLRVLLALPDGTFVYGVLHLFPLLLGDFEFVDTERVIDVAVEHPGVHRHGAMCLEWSVETSYYSAFFVERAGATTLRASLSDSDN